MGKLRHMSVRGICAAILGTALSTTACAMPGSQQTPAARTNPQQTCPDSCPATSSPATKPASTEAFPYPGEPSDSATLPASPTQSKPVSPAEKSTTSKEFPYPGEPDSTSGSSSSSSESPSDAPDPAKTASPDAGNPAKSTRRKLPKVEKLQSDEDREADDISVAHFYINVGNLQGAYLRAKDATAMQADDADAHLLLAEVAEKLNKRDEAIIEYKAYLKLDPGGNKSKAAQKSLARLQ